MPFVIDWVCFKASESNKSSTNWDIGNFWRNSFSYWKTSSVSRFVERHSGEELVFWEDFFGRLKHSTTSQTDRPLMEATNWYPPLGPRIAWINPNSFASFKMPSMYERETSFTVASVSAVTVLWLDALAMVVMTLNPRDARLFKLVLPFLKRANVSPERQKRPFTKCGYRLNHWHDHLFAGFSWLNNQRRVWNSWIFISHNRHAL